MKLGSCLKKNRIPGTGQFETVEKAERLRELPQRALVTLLVRAHRAAGAASGLEPYLGPAGRLRGVDRPPSAHSER